MEIDWDREARVPKAWVARKTRSASVVSCAPFGRARLVGMTGGGGGGGDGGGGIDRILAVRSAVSAVRTVRPPWAMVAAPGTPSSV